MKTSKKISGRWVYSVLIDLLRLRTESDRYLTMSYYGRVMGAVNALFDAGVISADVSSCLDSLALSAYFHAGKPFPDARNIGPVIPRHVVFQRDAEGAL